MKIKEVGARPAQDAGMEEHPSRLEYFGTGRLSRASFCRSGNDVYFTSLPQLLLCYRESRFVGSCISEALDAVIVKNQSTLKVPTC